VSKKQLSRRMDKRVLFAKVASPALLVTLSGCITFRPYVEPFDVKNPEYICGITTNIDVTRTKETSGTKETKEAKISDAFTYAVYKEKELIDRANTSATIQSATALALIPAAAFLGYRAAFSPNARVLGGLAAGGATAYAGANYAANPTIRKLYLTGAQAISCAIGVTAPYRVPEDLHNLELQASETMDEIDKKLEKAKQPIEDSVKKKVEDMRGTLNNAKQMTRRMFPGAAGAELGLCTTTNQILSAMNSQLDAAVPDLRPIASVFDRSSTAGLISSQAALSKSSVSLPSDASMRGLDTGDSNLSNMSDLMRQADKGINDLVDKVNATDPTAVRGNAGLQGCIDAQIPALSPPKLTNSNPVIVAQKVAISGAGASWTFDLSDGKPQYFVDIIPASAASMLVVSQSGSGSLVQIKIARAAAAAPAPAPAPPTAPPIKAAISIYDSAGNRFTPIELTVNP